MFEEKVLLIFIQATKSKNKINILQRLYTTRSAPISMTQMVSDSEICDNDFIREALETILRECENKSLKSNLIGNLNNIALDNH